MGPKQDKNFKYISRPASLMMTWPRQDIDHRCAQWRHQIETFSALLALCAGNSPVIGEFPSQSPVTRSFDVFFDLRLNKRLSKQSWGWWFETPSRSLWRHCNGLRMLVPNNARGSVGTILTTTLDIFSFTIFWVSTIRGADYRFVPRQRETALLRNLNQPWFDICVDL